MHRAGTAATAGRARFRGAHSTERQPQEAPCGNGQRLSAEGTRRGRGLARGQPPAARGCPAGLYPPRPYRAGRYPGATGSLCARGTRGGAKRGQTRWRRGLWERAWRSRARGGPRRCLHVCGPALAVRAVPPQNTPHPADAHPALFEVKHFGVGQRTGAQHYTAPAPCAHAPSPPSLSLQQERPPRPPSQWWAPAPQQGGQR